VDGDYSYVRDTGSYLNEKRSTLIQTPVEYYTGVGSPAPVDPWRFIASSQQWIDATKGIKFARFDVKVIFRIIGNPCNYGYLLTTFNPIDVIPNVASENADPRIIDFNTELTEIVYPWVNMYEYLILPLSGNDNIGKLTFLMSQNSIQSVAEDTSVEVSFVPVNIQLKGALQSSTGTRTALSAAVLGVPLVLNGIRNNIHTVQDVLSTAKDTYHSAEEVYEQGKSLQETISTMWKPTEEKLLNEVHNVPSVYGELSTLEYSPVNAVTHTEVPRKIPYHLGDLYPQHFIHDILRVPCIKKRFQLVNSTPLQIIMEPGISSDTVTYVDTMSRLFKYWRGGMDLNFHFFSTSLASVTYEIRYKNINSRGAAPPASVPGLYDYRKRLVVKGNTRLSLQLPYISNTEWMRVGRNNLNWYEAIWDFTIQMVYSGGDGDLPCHPYIVLVVRPSADFQFKSLTSPLTKAKVQMRVRSAFETPTPDYKQRVPRIYESIPEDLYTVEKLCKRWSSRVIASEELTNTAAGVTPGQYDLLDYLMSQFAFQRGNIRWSTLSSGTTAAPVQYVGSRRYGNTSSARIFAHPTGSGIVKVDPTTNPVAKWETTWDSKIEWGLTQLYRAANVFSRDLGDDLSGEPVLITPFASQSTAAASAAGRGFQLAYLLPPVTIGFLI